MINNMNRQDLENLQKLCDEATPGPWTASGNYPFYVDLEKPASSLSKHDNKRPTYWRYQDGIFVLASRDAMPKLLHMLNSVIKNLQAEIERDYPNLDVNQKKSLLDSQFGILTSFGKPELIKADLGKQIEPAREMCGGSMSGKPSACGCGDCS